ncbi:MAG: C39 family peptidase [Chitinivorax sp.]|jgi:predicted double-glycine peptidase
MFLTLVMAMMAMANVGLTETQRELPEGVYQVSTNLAPGQHEVLKVRPLDEIKRTDMIHQAYDYSCGSAALTTVMNFFLGENLQENEVMEGMLKYGEKDKIVQRRGFSLLDMKRYVATLGYKGAGFKAEIQDLLDLRQPGLVTIQYAGFKHFVVFRELRDGHVYLADPSMGKISFTVEHFKSMWDGNVLFLVYPKSNTEPVNKLALSDEDLRIMDADRIRQTVWAKTPYWDETFQNKVDAAAGGIFNYRR